MSVASGVKRMMFRALIEPRANRWLVRPLRGVPALRRIDAVARLPVVGEFDVAGPGHRIVMRSDGRDSIASSLFWHGLDGFEPETVLPFGNLAAASRTILDIGANSGLYSLVAATANLSATVVAFEPMPLIAEYLRGNIEVNRLENVAAEEIALGASEGEVEFYVPAATTLPLSGSVRAGFRQPAATLRVPIERLDSYVERVGLRDIDLVKIDTETTEPDVIAGGSGTIERDRPAIVCEVLRGRTETELQRAFEGFDYRYFKFSDSGLTHHTELVGQSSGDRNYLFVPSERVAWVERHVGVPMVY